jgi:hypothetical protein
MNFKMPSTNPTILSKINFPASGTAKFPTTWGHHGKAVADPRQVEGAFNLKNHARTTISLALPQNPVRRACQVHDLPWLLPEEISFKDTPPRHQRAIESIWEKTKNIAKSQLEATETFKLMR